jgi:hypothetical protein
VRGVVNKPPGAGGRGPEGAKARIDGRCERERERTTYRVLPPGSTAYRARAPPTAACWVLGATGWRLVLGAWCLVGCGCFVGCRELGGVGRESELRHQTPDPPAPLRLAPQPPGRAPPWALVVSLGARGFQRQAPGRGASLGLDLGPPSAKEQGSWALAALEQLGPRG